MGAPYEFNWYLVVASNEAISNINNNSYLTKKTENRIYPINSEIPLIIKNVGCVAIVRIVSFKITENETEIEFQYIERFDVDSVVALHYYKMYTLMKLK